MLVDCVLFPIDTIKTRLQSEKGFWRSGGVTNLYRGLAPAAAGSAPTAALFFTTYEFFKKFLHQYAPNNSHYVHMASASAGEVVACLIRVPIEVVKQRRQAKTYKFEASFLRHIWDSYKSEGLCRGVYRGFGTTISREIPFSLIQFPLWEYFKLNWMDVTGLPLNSASSALCGAVAGGIAAAATTPLDVAKTRIMLADTTAGANQTSFGPVLLRVYREKGVSGLFAGIVPRVTWIFIGGGIFFGFYELTKELLNDGNDVNTVKL